MHRTAIELCFIIGTNIISLPSIVWSFYYAKYTEGITILLTALISSIFHLCWGTDCDICLFGSPKLWWLLDFVFIYVLISVICTYAIEFPKPNIRGGILLITFLFGLIAELVVNAKFYFANVFPPDEQILTYIVLFLFLGSVFVLSTIINKKMPRIDYVEMLFGVSFLFIGIIILISSKKTSWFVVGHSVWHVFVFISVYFFLEMTEVGRFLTFWKTPKWHLLPE